MPDFEWEDKCRGIVCGIDEAGRGPWAGPVVAGAVIIKDRNLHPDLLSGLDYSKKLSAKKREKLYNLLFEEEKNGKAELALVDGNQKPRRFNCAAQTVVKGDAKSYSISAASIVAKVYRDRLMAELAQKYPYYGFEKNAGYGTAAHIASLKQYGVTPQHRKSYKPIQAFMTEKGSADIND